MAFEETFVLVNIKVFIFSNPVSAMLASVFTMKKVVLHWHNILDIIILEAWNHCREMQNKMSSTSHGRKNLLSQILSCLLFCLSLLDDSFLYFAMELKLLSIVRKVCMCLAMHICNVHILLVLFSPCAFHFQLSQFTCFE